MTASGAGKVKWSAQTEGRKDGMKEGGRDQTGPDRPTGGSDLRVRPVGGGGWQKMEKEQAKSGFHRVPPPTKTSLTRCRGNAK